MLSQHALLFQSVGGAAEQSTQCAQNAFSSFAGRADRHFFQRIECGRARYGVIEQPLGPLETLQGAFGVWAENAVRGHNKTVAVERLLQLPDCVAG